MDLTTNIANISIVSQHQHLNLVKLSDHCPHYCRINNKTNMNENEIMCCTHKMKPRSHL